MFQSFSPVKSSLAFFGTHFLWVPNVMKPDVTLYPVHILGALGALRLGGIGVWYLLAAFLASLSYKRSESNDCCTPRSYEGRSADFF
jgi:hypothetical protein